MANSDCNADGNESQPARPNVVESGAVGRTGKGNGLAVTHGLYALELPPELQHLRAEIADYEAACLVDEGDSDDVPTRRRSLIEYRARLHRRVLQLDDALELHGLRDRRGRLRVGWLSKLESLIAAAVRIDNLLGLERRPKPIDPVAAVRQAVTEANQ